MSEAPNRPSRMLPKGCSPVGSQQQTTRIPPHHCYHASRSVTRRDSMIEKSGNLPMSFHAWIRMRKPLPGHRHDQELRHHQSRRFWFSYLVIWWKKIRPENILHLRSSNLASSRFPGCMSYVVGVYSVVGSSVGRLSRDRCISLRMWCSFHGQAACNICAKTLSGAQLAAELSKIMAYVSSGPNELEVVLEVAGGAGFVSNT